MAPSALTTVKIRPTTVKFTRKHPSKPIDGHLVLASRRPNVVANGLFNRGGRRQLRAACRLFFTNQSVQWRLARWALVLRLGCAYLGSE